MFERFTGRARRTIVLAQEEARIMNHNYIGTEHILLGLIHESHGIGGQVLAKFDFSLEGTREEVVGMVGVGKSAPAGHIPFTPRAKKTLELALREALALHHNYIGTEHILLGLIREGEGIAARILRKHAGDLLKVRMAVLDTAGTAGSLEPRGRNWLRRVAVAIKPGDSGEIGEAGEQPVLNATPAADATLSTAAQLAGGEPVGSHHLLLAALADANSAAARVLQNLGVDLTRAKDALDSAEITGTSDELPEEAGRRQMSLQVTKEMLTVVVTDEALVKVASEAVEAIGPDAAPGGVIRGADLSGLPATSLAKAWQSLSDALSAVTAQARAASQAAASQAAAEAAGEGEDGSSATGAGAARP